MSMDFSAKIRETESVIRRLSGEISSHRYDVERLRQTKARLIRYYDHFIEKSEHVSKPSLTKNTWNGELANEFLSFRQYEWKKSYLAIPNKQLSKRIEEIEQRINQIDSKIIRLENQVNGKRVHLSYLESRYREVLT
ncbi:YwqH-like family protein [Pseudogracilibacillus sp. SO30301A]|uniref:YwqH-like family protein n=1 Tax=Pseudogracilibacillus sp. SO30301A TaxID=3098291 RepID=UPI00300DF8CC